MSNTKRFVPDPNGSSKANDLSRRDNFVRLRRDQKEFDFQPFPEPDVGVLLAARQESARFPAAEGGSPYDSPAGPPAPIGPTKQDEETVAAPVESHAVNVNAFN